MEIEGFGEIVGIIALAKELHDIGRFDIVQNQFFDTLCYDSWYENTMGVISSVFSGFYNNYDDCDETEIMIFTDDVISNYFVYAWEHGKKTYTPFDKNPYVLEAEREVSRRLGFCYSIGWKLLGYSKTRRTARQSKLIICVSVCDCDCHSNLALSLIQLYQWFADKCSEFRNQTKSIAEDVMAA